MKKLIILLTACAIGLGSAFAAEKKEKAEKEKVQSDIWAQRRSLSTVDQIEAHNERLRSSASTSGFATGSLTDQPQLEPKARKPGSNRRRGHRKPREATAVEPKSRTQTPILKNEVRNP